MKKKLLWVGDGGCPSGFAKATHEILKGLYPYFDITVLALNYAGDPHEYPYKMYACFPGGDTAGYGRIIWMCDVVQPDIIMLQNDGWNIPGYVHVLRQNTSTYNGEHKHIPVVAAVAVDGKNFDARWLNDNVKLAIFWTEFGQKEAIDSGYVGPSAVVPLGVDQSVFYPQDKYAARLKRGLPKELDDAFIVGNVNRNQPRKRWDLMIQYFSEWVKEYKVEDAFLYLHVAPTGDKGIDVRRVLKYYGLHNRCVLVEPAMFYGVTEEEMALTYNCFDVAATTTQGEGFGLTAFEAMACGVPLIAPEWSALGELCKGAAELVPCTSTAIGPPYNGVIGGVPDKQLFIEALQRVYSEEIARVYLTTAGLNRVAESRYRWENISAQYVQLLDKVLLQHG